VNHKSAVIITLIKKLNVYYSTVVGYGMLQAFNFGIQGNKKQQI